VAGAGNGQKFGDALDNTEEKGFKGMHQKKLPEMLENATGKWGTGMGGAQVVDQKSSTHP
jgi:hypothetical protein